MKKKKSEKVKTDNVPLCPYCSTPDFFGDVLSEPVSEAWRGAGMRFGAYWNTSIPLVRSVATKARTERRGRYTVEIYPDELLADYLSGFTVTLVSVEPLDYVFAFRPNVPPFFHMGGNVPNLERPGWLFYFFFAFHITHKQIKTSIESHWWPTHGRIITLLDTPDEGMLPVDFKIISNALKVFRLETRGGGQRIEEVELIEAVQVLGEKATQDAVARRLGVTRKTLYNWLKNNGKEWETTKKEYLETELI